LNGYEGPGPESSAAPATTLLSMASELIPAVTLALGAVGTLGAQGLRERFTLGREREARTAERQVARDALQRETLLELQDAILRVVRNTSQLRIHHQIVYASKGTYARELDPPELSDENREAMAITTRLRQRVLDDELRQHVRDVQELCTQITMPPQVMGETDEQAARRAEEASGRLARDYNDLENHLGRVLRTLL
jgi:hypothetical protein